MSARPRISLCIPTYNRASYFREALESGLREVMDQPPGTVELLVCDNASTDGTWELITGYQAEHPELAVYRNAENLGFDRNYLRCVEEARGEFVWVMGDDDVWLPGSLARVLQELDAGADACLCLAEACDLDLNPLFVLPWFLEDEPPTVWRLEQEADLVRYFDACARTAGAFAFISVSIFRRDRFLQDREGLQRSLDSGYPHLWAMMRFLREPTNLHYIPECLVRNRISDLHANSYANTDLYGRWMQDLRGWAMVADAVFSDQPEAHRAFSHVLGRNHHNTIVPGLRRCAPTEAAWREAAPYLERAGFTPVQIAGVDLAHQLLKGERHPMPGLDAASLCVGDLRILARAARRVAVLAPKGAEEDVACLLPALDPRKGPNQLRFFGASEPKGTSPFAGCELWDEARLQEDPGYREACGQALRRWAPELILSLDRGRSEAWDELARTAGAAGTLGFEEPSGLDPARDRSYSRLLPSGAPVLAILEALGWPSQVS